MKRTWRRGAGPVRPGLTLVELIIAIGCFGLMGALLLPRVAPVQAPEPASAAPADASDPCLPSGNTGGLGFSPGWFQGPYVGIGAALDRERDDDGSVRIDRPFPGDPAEQAGLEPGDTILQVNGHSVQDEDVDTVTDAIRDGRIGSTVELTIGREGYDQPLDVTVTRACIHLPAPFRADRY